MASPPRAIPVSPRTLRMDTSDHIRNVDDVLGGHSVGSPQHPARLSPTLTRSYDPTRPENLERQRTMDADFALQLSRARSASIALAHHPSLSQLQDGTGQSLPNSLTRTESLSGIAVEEEDDTGYFPSNINENISGTTTGIDTPPTLRLGGVDPAMMMSQGHDPTLLVSSVNSKLRRSNSGIATNRMIPESSEEAPPPFDTSPDRQPILEEHRQPTGGGIYRSRFDFAWLESFATEERERLGISFDVNVSTQPLRKRYSTQPRIGSDQQPTAIPEEHAEDTAPPPAPVDSEQETVRQRRESLNVAQPKKPGGKLALFESAAASMPPFDFPPMPMRQPLASTAPHSEQPTLIPPTQPDFEDGRPYRFTFYSNNLRSTIHSRSLSELPAGHQTFEELFVGKKADPMVAFKAAAAARSSAGTPSDPLVGVGKNDIPSWNDEDNNTWWLDVLCPTDQEMRALSKCFGIHPLTAEDIQMEETREKIELFRNYYLVCFRSFDQNQYSPTYLDPINYYIVVFREGILSFHFRDSPHPQNVRRRIKQLKDYISVTSDWISYALIDDITDAFGPLIQSIEYEVDSIDELVLILKEAEQSDMLRRIGTCRKKVMGLLRLMGNKADVVKGLAKRCNENWSMAPKSDIGLYLSDIQDHLITMTQSLNHYEKLLSRSHSNYLAQISIEMTDANNQINDVLSRLTALGTILIPMNLITGLWGMNVHVPGQDIHTGYAWFIGIICFLVGIGGLGSWGAYRLMRRGRKRS